MSTATRSKSWFVNLLREPSIQAAAAVWVAATVAIFLLSHGKLPFDRPGFAALSVIFAVMTFICPGIVKSFLTLRTRNAWVHLWGYHAIAPHVTMDSPNIVRMFNIR